MLERMQDLKCKEVIDVCTGCRIGFIEDCELDLATGRILTIIVPKGAKFGFWNREDIIIPWRNIKKIGEDLVLVDTRPVDHKIICDK